MSTGRREIAKVWVQRAGRLACLLAGAGLAVSHLHAAGVPATGARLVGVSTRIEGRATAVVIETSEPVAYVTAQPDPLTVLVDLRNVSTDAIPTTAARQGVVADVQIESARANDGASLVRVKLTLVRPGKPTIRSRWNTVLVEFDGRVASAASPVAQTANPKPSPVPAQTPPPATSQAKRAVQKPAPAAAGTLTAIETSTGPDGTRVRFTGTGTLTPSSVGPTAGLPARLVIDFPGVTTLLPAVTPVGKGPVDKIRVAINSRQPLITRAVIDLKYPVAHRVEKSDTELTILLDPASDKPTPTPTPTPIVTPVAAPPKPAPAPVVAAPPPSQKAASQPPPPATFVVVPPAPAVSGAPPAPAQAVVNAPALGVPAPRTDLPTPAPAAQADQKPAPAQPGAADAGPKKYTGHLISFDFQQADLRAVLRSFTEISGLNVIVDPAITGTVDVFLKEVPWDQALEIILTTNKLGYTVENNVVRIAPLDALAAEETAHQKLKDAQALTGELKVMTRTLSYAKAEDMSALLLKSVLSTRGQIQVDKRTNTIIISDLPEKLGPANDLIAALDRAEPQVEIEARIVQTTRDSARALGVQWGMSGKMNSELGNTSPVAFPAQGSISGRTGASQGDPSGAARTQLPAGVNLPVTGATSALGLAMGTLNGSFNLDVALSALVHKGNTKVLSQPKVMMQNNYEAEMTQGVQIPIQTVSNNTVTVSFKDAALQLKVKPQITNSGTIILDVFLENATPDYSRSVNGIPPIDTQRAKSQVLIKDMETVVIGGIMTSRESGSKEGVPGLSKIPLLGWLFRRDSVTDEGRELLIFITPKIRR